MRFLMADAARATRRRYDFRWSARVEVDYWVMCTSVVSTAYGDQTRVFRYGAPRRRYRHERSGGEDTWSTPARDISFFGADRTMETIPSTPIPREIPIGTGATREDRRRVVRSVLRSGSEVESETGS